MASSTAWQGAATSPSAEHSHPPLPRGRCEPPREHQSIPESIDRDQPRGHEPAQQHPASTGSITSASSRLHAYLEVAAGGVEPGPSPLSL
jgi:hypothetical protein